jgi:hypothetical protein
MKFKRFLHRVRTLLLVLSVGGGFFVAIDGISLFGRLSGTSTNVPREPSRAGNAAPTLELLPVLNHVDADGAPARIIDPTRENQSPQVVSGEMRTEVTAAQPGVADSSSSFDGISEEFQDCSLDNPWGWWEARIARHERGRLFAPSSQSSGHPCPANDGLPLAEPRGFAGESGCCPESAVSLESSCVDQPAATPDLTTFDPSSLFWASGAAGGSMTGSPAGSGGAYSPFSSAHGFGGGIGTSFPYGGMFGSGGDWNNSNSDGTGGGGGGTNPIPEPSSVIVWSLLGGLCVSLAFGRRKTAS